MSKISLIIKREYTTRVMKKSFIILTFLTPLLFAGMIAVPIWLASIKDSNKKHIVVIDKIHAYSQVMKSNESYIFVPLFYKVISCTVRTLIIIYPNIVSGNSRKIPVKKNNRRT